MRYTLIRLLGVTMITTLLLAACGKAGSPHAPGPSDQITYPKIYPTE